jgi:hypothetical protein
MTPGRSPCDPRGGSSGQPCISIAMVNAAGGWAEPWQTPEFDEWVLVTKGRVLIEHSHGTGKACVCVRFQKWESS